MIRRKFVACIGMMITAVVIIMTVRVSVRAEEAAPGLDGMHVFFENDRTAEVPIIMYHLVTKNGKYVGRYGITPEELESDLKYLRDEGYETVVIADLVKFVEKGRALPEKPVVLTFDDGNFSDYRYLYPLLKQYKAKAVLAVLGKQTDAYTEAAQARKQTSFPNLTWPQIREMLDSGFVEIQSHGYDLHGSIGSAKRKNESTEAYQARLRADLEKLQARCKEELRREPTAFAYPLGLMSERSQEVLDALRFKASFSCCEGMNVLRQGDERCLFRLKRNIRPSGRPIGKVLEKIKR